MKLRPKEAVLVKNGKESSILIDLVESGDILIDGQSIYDSKISSLRSNISLVTQDVTLFDDSIKNNIAYANLDASDTVSYTHLTLPTKA